MVDKNYRLDFEMSDGTTKSVQFAVPIPAKGVDYFTPADQESIVQQVIAAMGTPVFGRVDEENNIILSGELADGVYTLKYEDAEGNIINIGTINQSSGPSYTNQIPVSIDSDGSVFNGTGFMTNYRLNSSGAAVAYDGVNVTGFIPVKYKDVVYLDVPGFNYNASNAHRDKLYAAFYDSSFTFLGYIKPNATDTTITSFNVDTAGFGEGLTGGNLSSDFSSVAYFRVCAVGLDDTNVITVNEPITE